MADRLEPADGSMARVPARAALAGNPSDGHGGAVVAVPLPRLTATTHIRPSRAHSVVGHAPGTDLAALVAATLRAAVRLVDVPPSIVEHTEVAVDTTIPRSVGLAGSSAIAIGVLRALGATDPSAPWAAALARPAVLAVVAHQAEVAELGIAAGLQDRLVQAHGAPLAMEFGATQAVEVLGLPSGRVGPLPPPPGRYVLAHREVAAESSGVVHGDLARRTDIDAAMTELARTARSAAAAIRRGSADDLGAAMDRTFDLRNELLDLDPRHVEMVDVARRAGGHANYTGSGGAVIVLCRDDEVDTRVTAAMRTLDGCTVTLDPLGDARDDAPGDAGDGAGDSVSHPPA